MKVSVITVCRNSVASVEATVQSVLAQDYPELEYIVVDGASTDGTLEVLRKYAARISSVVSEPDGGVYNAMNKGMRLAKGVYLLFMNAGDTFASVDVLSKAVAAGGEDVVYGDYAYSDGPRKGRVSADIDRGVFNHQCILYRRVLHERFGTYFDVKGLTTADYLFFMQLRASSQVSIRKLDFVFAIVDPHGISAGRQTFLQVNLIDCLLGRRGRYATALRIAAHPLFHALRGLVRRIR